MKKYYQHDTMKYEELEILIERKSAEFEELAKEVAAKLAEKLLPRSHGDDLTNYVQPIRAEYMALWGLVMKTIQSSGFEQDQIAEEEEQLNVALALIDEKLAAEGHRRRSLEVDLGRIVTDYPWKRYKWVNTGLLIIMVSETAINSRNFSLMGDNLISAWLIAVAISISVLLAAHFSPRLIRWGRTALQRLAIGVGIVGFMTTIFYMIARLRILSLSGTLDLESSATGATELVGISPLIFALINLLFFSISAAISYYLYPKRADFLKKETREDLAKEIKNSDTTIAALEAERDELKQAFQIRAYGMKMNLRFQGHLKEYITTLYQRCVGCFITESCIRLDNREIPDCFQCIPPLFTDNQNS